MSDNMVDNLIKERYCIGDERSWEDICKRVSDFIGTTDKEKLEFYNMMAAKDFLPNSPTIMNAGTKTPMLSACFKSGTMIETSTIPTPIELIKSGDVVLSHDGTYNKVTNTMKRKDFIYKVKIDKLPPLYVTKEHPILTNNGWKYIKDITPKKDFVKIVSPVVTQKTHTIIFDGIEINGMIYDQIINKDSINQKKRNYNIHTKPIKNNIVIDKDLSWLIGMYLAEGSISEGYDIRFVLNINEQDYATRIMSIIKNKFGLNCTIKETLHPTTWLTVRCHSKFLATWLNNNFGHGFDKKYIPNWVFKLDHLCIHSLIQGVDDGDGANSNIKSRQIILCNEPLIRQLFTLIKMIGYSPSLCIWKLPKLGTTLPCQIQYKHHNMGMVINSDYYRVRSVEPLNEKCDVYNFEVENTHTYVANQIAVHNCFYLPIDDSISNGKDGIFDQVRNAALIFKFGGGVGLNFSNLRPAGSKVQSTNGVSSGVISFMKNFNTMTETIKQGGKRRGALMGSLDIDHPEIHDFVTCKNKEGDLSNFNISVKITDKFMNSPDEELLTKIVDGIYKNGEPGILFKDTIEKYNPAPEFGELNVNPCAEALLYPFESCLTGDTLIRTPNRLYRIDELLHNTNFDVISYNNQIETLSKCDKVIDNGNKEVYLVTIDGGLTIKSTDDHKYMTNDGWKMLKDIDIEEDYIITQSTLPLNITTERNKLYEMFGWMHGDGWFTKTIGISFNNQDGDFEIKDEYIKIFKDYFGVTCNPMRDDNISIQLQTDKTECISKALQLGFVRGKAYQKELPTLFNQYTLNEQRSFLRGLFSADGTIRGNQSNQIYFASNSERLVHQVQLILATMGIQSRITKTIFKTEDRKPQYRLVITKESAIKYMQLIGFIQTNKSNKFNWKSERAFSDKLLKIISIEYCGNEKVYDLIVPYTHCFFANGILVHNCNLGSINWSHIAAIGPSDSTWKDSINWEFYEWLIRNSVKFLNHVIDKNQYPLPEIDVASKRTRKIGLGGMGFHDLLLKLNVPYESDLALEIGKELELFMKKIAKDESDKNKFKNTSLTTIAPTGTISIIAETSSCIEPVFNWVLTRKDSLGEHYVVHPIFEKRLEKELETLDYNDIITIDNQKITNGEDFKLAIIHHCHSKGTIQDIDILSDTFKKLFKNAMDINWKHHVAIQAVFQNNGVDMSISKTINLPNNAPKEVVKDAIYMAWKSGCKGLTIYRSGSRENEVLNLKKEEIKPVITPIHNSNGVKRPRCLFGATYKVQSGCGKLFVTINENQNGKPYEVIIQSGGSGGCEAGNQALGRAISLALRTGGDIRSIIKQLCKVKCPAALRNPKSEGKSCSDIIGKLIEEYIPDADIDEIPSHVEYETCPDCHKKTLVREAGCKVCHSCGYSKCG